MALCENPNNANVWLSDPDTHPIISQILRIYHFEKHSVNKPRKVPKNTPCSVAAQISRGRKRNLSSTSSQSNPGSASSSSQLLNNHLLDNASTNFHVQDPIIPPPFSFSSTSSYMGPPHSSISTPNLQMSSLSTTNQQLPQLYNIPPISSISPIPQFHPGSFNQIEVNIDFDNQQNPTVSESTETDTKDEFMVVEEDSMSDEDQTFVNS